MRTFPRRITLRLTVLDDDSQDTRQEQAPTHPGQHERRSLLCLAKKDILQGRAQEAPEVVPPRSPYDPTHRTRSHNDHTALYHRAPALTRSPPRTPSWSNVIASPAQISSRNTSAYLVIVGASIPDGSLDQRRNVACRKRGSLPPANAYWSSVLSAPAFDGYL